MDIVWAEATALYLTEFELSVGNVADERRSVALTVADFGCIVEVESSSAVVVIDIALASADIVTAVPLCRTIARLFFHTHAGTDRVIPHATSWALLVNEWAV